YRSSELPVPHERVAPPVRVTGHEVRGPGVEGDEPAIGAEREITGRSAVGDPGRGPGHEFGSAGPQVVDEDVCYAVRVAGHEVRSGGRERDVSPVSADRGPREQ